MSWWNKAFNVFRSGRLNRELDEELEFHIAMRAEENERSGMSRREARWAAERQFGNTLLERERARDADVTGWLDTVAQDVKYACRMLMKTPALTAVVVVSLALGIGANTAIFTLTNAMLLRSLPVRDPQGLAKAVVVYERHCRDDSFTYPLWEEIRARQDVFSTAFAYSYEDFNMSDGGEEHRVNGAYCSGEMFPALGLEPALGRAIGVADDRRGGGEDGYVAMVGYDYWRRAYGGDTGVIGGTIRLNGKPLKIVGVAPEGFHGVSVGQRADVIVPVTATAYVGGDASAFDQRSWWWLNIIGRLKPGLSRQGAEARLKTLAAGIMERTQPPDWRAEELQEYFHQSLGLEPAARGLTNIPENIRMAVVVLNCVVALVLLIACANVANLLMARAAAREREISVRIALGASRIRVTRQLLTESLLLALMGAALGVVGAPWAARLLVNSTSTARSNVYLDLQPDATMLLFTTAVAVLCGLMFGAAPAWRASHVTPSPGLREASGSTGDRKGRLRGTLVAVQVAMSVVLLVGSGLFLTTLRNLSRTDLGFDPENVLLVNVDMQRSGVADGPRAVFYADLLERFKGIAGVRSASSSTVTPMAGMAWQSNIQTDDGQGGRKNVHAHFNSVSSGYFQTLRTPLLAGRDFDGADRVGAPLRAVVNETFAREAFGGRNPLGLRLEEDGPPGPKGPVKQWVEVIGVVKDAKYRTQRQVVPPTVFRAMSQAGRPLPMISFELRMDSGEGAVVAAVKAAMKQANPKADYTLRAFSTQVKEVLVAERLVAGLCVLFGALALGLASLGLYGVLAYSVAQRKGEIGVRMALGARPAEIRNWVLRQSVWTVGAGVVVGLAAAVWVLPLAKTLLYGVQANEWRVYCGGLGVLLTIAALASYLPARRATKMDPVEALRHE